MVEHGGASGGDGHSYDAIAGSGGGMPEGTLVNGRRMVGMAGKSPKGNTRLASDQGEKVPG